MRSKKNTPNELKQKRKLRKIKPHDLCTPIPISKVNSQTKARRQRELTIAKESLKKQDESDKNNKGKGCAKGGVVYKIVPCDVIVKRHKDYLKRKQVEDETKKIKEKKTKSKQQQKEAFTTMMYVKNL